MQIENGLYSDYLADSYPFPFPSIYDFAGITLNATHDLDSQVAHETVCDEHVQPVLGMPLAFFVENNGTLARMALKWAGGVYRARHAWHYNEVTDDDAGYAEVFQLTPNGTMAYELRERHTMWGLS